MWPIVIVSVTLLVIELCLSLDIPQHMLFSLISLVFISQYLFTNQEFHSLGNMSCVCTRKVDISSSLLKIYSWILCLYQEKFLLGIRHLQFLLRLLWQDHCDCLKVSVSLVWNHFMISWLCYRVSNLEHLQWIAVIMSGLLQYPNWEITWESWWCLEMRKE